MVAALSMGRPKYEAYADLHTWANDTGRALADQFPDFAVYEVEVCQGCGWNHLVRSYRTGTPGAAPAPPVRKQGVRKQGVRKQGVRKPRG